MAAAFAEWGQGVAIEQAVNSSRDGDEVSFPPDVPVLVKTYLPLADPSWQARRERIEKAVWALGLLRQVSPLSVHRLLEVDWADAWKAHFFVHRIGRRTVIVPSWREGEYVARPDDVALLLDPGMAFGTGLHPTTRMCLRLVEELIQPGQRVLDLGAGSGILAIAAARLGASAVDAIEIEHVAARVCKENVERNGVGGIVHVRQGSLPHRGPRFDLALANITIRTLLELHGVLARRLKHGALGVLSGVLEDRADELLSTLGANGWRHVRTEHEQDWVAMVVEAP